MLDWFGNLWRNFAFTPLANLCGIPAISLPLAAHENGLPLGIQAIAKQANDGLLLQFAAQIERAIDGKWNGGRSRRCMWARLRTRSKAIARDLAFTMTLRQLLLPLPVHRQRLVRGPRARQR